MNKLRESVDSYQQSYKGPHRKARPKRLCKNPSVARLCLYIGPSRSHQSLVVHHPRRWAILIISLVDIEGTTRNSIFDSTSVIAYYESARAVSLAGFDEDVKYCCPRSTFVVIFDIIAGAVSSLATKKFSTAKFLDSSDQLRALRFLFKGKRSRSSQPCLRMRKPLSRCSRNLDM